MTLARISTAAAFALLVSFASVAAAAEPSLYDKARSGTTRAAKATGSALERAADRTGEFVKQVPQKVGVAAKKTDAALERAADKVGLPRKGKSGAGRNTSSPAHKAGPRLAP